MGVVLGKHEDGPIRMADDGVRDGTEPARRESACTMGGHHDEVGIDRFRGLRDEPGRIPFRDMRPDAHAPFAREPDGLCREVLLGPEAERLVGGEEVGREDRALRRRTDHPDRDVRTHQVHAPASASREVATDRERALSER